MQHFYTKAFDESNKILNMLLITGGFSRAVAVRVCSGRLGKDRS